MNERAPRPQNTVRKTTKPRGFLPIIKRMRKLGTRQKPNNARASLTISVLPPSPRRLGTVYNQVKTSREQVTDPVYIVSAKRYTL